MYVAIIRELIIFIKLADPAFAIPFFHIEKGSNNGVIPLEIATTFPSYSIGWSWAPPPTDRINICMLQSPHLHFHHSYYSRPLGGPHLVHCHWRWGYLSQSSDMPCGLISIHFRFPETSNLSEGTIVSNTHIALNCLWWVFWIEWLKCSLPGKLLT